jgi:rhodanese-related sulfurtransferase
VTDSAAAAGEIDHTGTVAYCAAGRRQRAAELLEEQGLSADAIVEHPWLPTRWIGTSFTVSLSEWDRVVCVTRSRI